jgi:tetratricopeptide (TPR) repeat protein
MSVRGLYPILWLLVIGCAQVGVGQDKPPVAAAEVYPDSEPNAQMQLYKETLINKGSTEQMRINAANLLLSSRSVLAREVLLDVLKQSSNAVARAAVCEALSAAGAEQKVIDKSEDFIIPLVEILHTAEEPVMAGLAAEALLLYKYKQVAVPLEAIASDGSLPVKSRLSAIYALKLQAQKAAVFKLMDLLDDPEPQVAGAANSALVSLGIRAGSSSESRGTVRRQIERESEAEFLRGILVRTTSEVRRYENELGRWKEQYLEVLNRIYDGFGPDVSKGDFLVKYLTGPDPIVKLWALRKAYEDRMSPNPQLSPEVLGPGLLNLISFPDKDVRLKTAQLLSLMGGLNPAEKLLEQLKVEENDEVRTEILGALGVVCYRGLLASDSQSSVSPEVRKGTLEWAGRYLNEADPVKAQLGAEVIRKVLERNGLKSSVDKYLRLLVQRYQQEKDNNDGVLRGGLLNAMSGLCAQGSACKAEAAQLFGGLFNDGLTEKVDLVRSAAVDGVIHVDGAVVMAKLRKTDLINDSSTEIRGKIIKLAGETGTEEDLSWLWEKSGISPDGLQAWEAMLRIFKRSDFALLSRWMQTINTNEAAKLSDEQKLAFLETVAAKVGENNVSVVKDIWRQLVSLYQKSGKYAQASDYLEKLLSSAGNSEEKDAIVWQLMGVYLRVPNSDKASNLVNNSLANKDLGAESGVITAIDNYLSEPPAGSDPNEVLRAMVRKVRGFTDRPKWQEQLKKWGGRLVKGPRTEEVKDKS